MGSRVNEPKSRGNWGGARPGSGRPRKHPKPITGTDLGAAIRREFAQLRAAEDREATRILAIELRRLAEGQANIEALLQRHLLEVRRGLGLVEEPKAPRLSRRRPLA
jgi:hypothetical protein